MKITGDYNNIKVTLLDEDVVKNALVNIGSFASICKNGKLPDESTLRRIGLDCIRSNHGSPVRSVNIRFTIDGISRVCSHQLVRHSVGVAINQQSGVFQGIESSVTNYTVPKSVTSALQNDIHTLARYYDLLEECTAMAELLQSLGVSNSDSRYIIPQSINTSLNICVSLEALIHLAHERLCSKAQWEIREVVRQMCTQVVSIEPSLKDFLVPKCIFLHGCNERKGCGMYNTWITKSYKIDTTPLEKRTKVYVCKKCGSMLTVLEDDTTSSIVNTGLCRKCEREELEKKLLERG